MKAADTLTKNCLLILAAKGFYCWRQNNSAVFDATKKVYRSNSATKGIPDILGFHTQTGTFICVEIKVGKDSLSVHQKDFLQKAINANAFVFVIKTSDDIEKMVKQIKL